MATTRKTTAVAAPRRTTLLLATRKGLWTLASDATRRAWKLSGPHFLGHIVHHAVTDPRDGKTTLAAARTGHLGPTVFRSTDRGRTWKEAAQPPAFKAGSGRTVDHTFWLTPGHASRAGRLVRRHLAAGAVPLRRRRRHVGRRRRLQRAPPAQGLVRRGPGRHAGRPEAALDQRGSAGCPPPVHRDVEWRHLRVDRRRCRLAAAEPRRQGAVHAGPRSGVRARSALPAAASPGPRPALPPEPLRDLSAGPTGRPLGRYRRGDAQIGRRDRFSGRPASAGSGDPVGVSDGWLGRLAPDLAFAGSRRPIARSMAARPGSGRRPGCRRPKPGGRSSDRQ